MERFIRRVGLALAAAAVVAGCMAGAAGSAGPSQGGDPADEIWRTAALVDVRTDEAFTIDGLRGKLVAIEPMAIWCTSCRVQQREAVKAIAAVQSDDLVYVGLDVDPAESADDLATYSVELGFDWPFAIASTDVARSLAAAFGDQILSPPSTPLILVGPDGTILETHFGIRRAAELESLFRQHLP